MPTSTSAMMFGEHQPPRAIPSSSLLQLPFELRLQIYSYLIPQNRLVCVSSPTFRLPNHFSNDAQAWVIYADTSKTDANKHNNSILILSKQISTEALGILYGNNIFKLELNERGERRLKAKFVESNRRRISHIMLNITKDMPRHGAHIDAEFWAVFLPQLSSLQIVAIGSYRNRELSFHQRHRNKIWAAWVSAHLECLGSHINGETVVKVDDDGCVQLKQLFRKYLPEGYREEKCCIMGSK